MRQVHVGMNKNDVDTPALLINIEVVERNIGRMAEFFRNAPASLRPHIKTHKTPILAQMQLDAGAIGITCAKVSEAEVLVAAGIENIFIANQITGFRKIERLVCLARQNQVAVIVDDGNNVDDLSDAMEEVGKGLNVLVEIDVGMHRCGVDSAPAAIALARRIDKAPGLRFGGLMGYEGHAVMQPDLSIRKRVVQHAMTKLLGIKQMIEDGGLRVHTVSAGGTGTYAITGNISGVTEVQAGSYITMDGSYKKICPEFGCALTLLASVISVPSRNRVVLDCGTKSLSVDLGQSYVLGFKGIRNLSLSEEHLTLEVDEIRNSFHLGQKVEILPAHGCTTINLHDHLYAIRSERVEAIWPISARGKFW